MNTSQPDPPETAMQAAWTAYLRYGEDMPAAVRAAAPHIERDALLRAAEAKEAEAQRWRNAAHWDRERSPELEWRARMRDDRAAQEAATADWLRARAEAAPTDKSTE